MASARKVLSLLITLQATSVFRLKGITAGGAGTTAPSSISSYQLASGAEERWVAEEEFHGVSSSANESQRYSGLGQCKKEKRVKEPRSCPTHENFDEHSWWDDDDEYRESDDDRHMPAPLSRFAYGKRSNASKKKRWHRQRVYNNKNIRQGSSSSSAADHPSVASPTNGSSPDVDRPLASDYDEEHPMRTDEWDLDVCLSRLFRREEKDFFPEHLCDRAGQWQHLQGRRGCCRIRQVMQFARNGYVKVLENEVNIDDGTSITCVGKSRPRVGKWRIGHSGVAFDIPVQVHMRRKTGSSNEDFQSRMMMLHYHADIHLNKFGKRPRMFRGVITRDRHSSFLPPNFLRPVIGTFSAEGIGHDTADTSYRERAISLSRQQVSNDNRGRSLQ